MICLTGDVHHSTLRSNDLPYCKTTEVDAALEYARIASDHGLKVTLFCTGLCAKEAPKLIEKLTKMDNVEIGGHNYFAFKPRLPFKLYYRLTGLKNGPYYYQAWEVRKTKQVLKQVTNSEITSWRDHAYRHDKNTRKILASINIKYFSDPLSNDMGQPKWNTGVIDVPINTLPDHDYVYHGGRQPGSFDEESLRNSVFKTGAMAPADWLEKVKNQIIRIEEFGGVSTILAHPACMEVMDDFKTFEKLCQFINQYKTVFMREIGETYAEGFK